MPTCSVTWSTWRKTSAGGVPGLGEGAAGAEGVGTRPDEAVGARAALVPALGVREVGLDRLGALQVENRAERPAGDAALELIHRPDDAQQTLRVDEEVGHRGRL